MHEHVHREEDTHLCKGKKNICQAGKACLLSVAVLTSLLVFLEMNLRAASE